MAISDRHRKVIHDAWQNKRSVYLNGDNLEIRFQTKIEDVKDTHIVIRNSVTPGYLKTFLKSRNFYLQVMLVNFKASSIDSDGKNILIPLEESLNIKETRQSVRNEFFPGRKVLCEFVNPFDAKTVLRKRLMDLSDDGFSLITFVRTKLFKPGLEIKDIKFLLKEKTLTRSAKVRYIKTLLDTEGKHHTQIGFKFLQP